MIDKIIRPLYHSLKASYIRLNSRLKAGLLQRDYRFEYTFFENVRGRKYKDLGFKELRLRSLSHQIDKTLTLEEFKKCDKLAELVEELIREVTAHPEHDSIIVGWAKRVLEEYRLRKKESKPSGELPLPVFDESAQETLREIIESRRSIRRFKPTPIPEETLHKILRAGLWAPSGCNRQAINYLLLEEKSDIEFCQKMAGEISSFPAKAPVCVVVMADPRCYGLPNQRHMAYLEGGAAIECVILTAYSFNIGSCWLYWGDIKGRHEEFLQRFHLESWLMPVGMVCLGYIEKMPLICPERKELSSCLYYGSSKE